MTMNDVIIQAALEAHSEMCEIGYTMAPSEGNSLSGNCEVSSRLPAMAFHDAQRSPRGFPRNCSNASLVTKDYSGQSRAHLVVSTDQVVVSCPDPTLSRGKGSGDH